MRHVETRTEPKALCPQHLAPSGKRRTLLLLKAPPSVVSGIFQSQWRECERPHLEEEEVRGMYLLANFCKQH